MIYIAIRDMKQQENSIYVNSDNRNLKTKNINFFKFLLELIFKL